MTFFQIDPSLNDTILHGTEPISIKIDLSYKADDIQTIDHNSIESAVFYSNYEQTGIITSTAEITFSKDHRVFSRTEITEIMILLSCGNNSTYLRRFTLYPDDSNLQEIKNGGSKIKYRLRLEDIPARIKRIESAKDWSTPQTIVDGTISDKEHPESSIFHLIVNKAGIESSDIESCSILLSTPYTVLDRDTWTDLSDLAKTFKANIEGGTDKKLILSDSRYQNESQAADEIPELNENICYQVDEESAGELQKNDIRLRWNKPERLEHQTIWKYDEQPVIYNSNLESSYPFSFAGEKRRIEQEPPVEAQYSALLNGNKLPVVYGDQVDNQTIVGTRMQNQNGAVSIDEYDVESHKDRALIKLSCSADDEIKNLNIDGRPIVMHQNCSCYKRDEDSIETHGLKVMNVTGRYFLDADWNGKPQYEDWVDSTLEALKTKRKRYTLYTQYCIFFIRTGALTYFKRLDGSRTLCKITNLEMNYTKEDGFEIKTELTEE
ncbi:MAG: hypothetical protein PQJ61_00450 [Spirochaetales bacterium]|uniref:Uncharacterized protein n=1 Tax=Candidatus Thalassospirochaeta sargassi TaxID=3119039 RepID=A0AAJ1MHE8_9SPIO|nr:hypothetical protein [Spirochaetales bacterium]